MPQLCDYCKERPATCIGAYEGGRDLFACDECCGHTNEDGRCWSLDHPQAIHAAERRQRHICGV